MPQRVRTPIPPPPGYIWAGGAARLMGLSVKTLYNYRYQGRGPKAVVRGRKLAFRVEEVEAWIATQDAADRAR